MKIGQKIPQIKLPAIDNSTFDNETLQGKKYLLTFFRFATCPFCNMRIAELKRTKKMLGDNFEIVAVFESELAHLQKHANKHLATFPILADQSKEYYQMFGVTKSLFGVIKGMLFRFPTAIKGLLNGYIPLEISSRLLIMPLSILVDQKGVIQIIYYGQDEGDHIPIEQVIAFAQGD